MTRGVRSPGLRSFHKTDEAYLQSSDSAIKKAIESGKITLEDSQLIMEFIHEIRSTHHISSSRARKINSHLIGWRAFIGPFREAAIADVFAAIDKMKQYQKPNGTPYKQNTQRDLITFLKRFYLWMIDNGYSCIPEKKIQAIRPPSKNTMTKTAHDLLSEEEIRGMLNACRNSRDRALLAMLYEGGFRIGELGNLRWEQVKFNDWNVVVNVNDKTKRPRFIPLVMARPFLAQWRNDYPIPLKDEGFVFLTGNLHEPLQYAGVAKQLQVLARRSGIEKHITPHIFRHSRITHLIVQGYGESIIKKMMWGNLSTNMFQTYAHLTDSDIENEIAAKNGIISSEHRKKTDALEPRQCSKCYTVNPPTVNFCGTCGNPLSLEAGDKLLTAEQQAELLPEYQALLNKFKEELLSIQKSKA